MRTASSTYFVGNLIGVVDALLRKVEDVDTDGTETGDADLPNWSQSGFCARRQWIRRVSHWTGVWQKLRARSDGQSRIQNQRRVQKERNVWQQIAGSLKNSIAQLLEVQTRAAV